MAKKVIAKKAVKKAAPAKKVVVKKAAPAKKAAPKKVAPAKKVVVKKAAPAKKAAPKKVAPVKKVVAKKAAPVKKVSLKKAAPAKKTAPAKKIEVKKPIAKAAPKKVEAKPAPKKAAATVAPKKVEVKKVEEVKKSSPKKAAFVKPVKKEKFKPNLETINSFKNPDGIIIAHRDAKNLNRDVDNTNLLQPVKIKKKRPSILDGIDPATATLIRYSDSELDEFKVLINEKVEKARIELNYLQGLITRRDEAGTDDTENRYASMEDGAQSNEREQLNQMASRQIKFIHNLENALIRIENKSYGVCRERGILIDKKRLYAVPHATLSKEAKDQRN